MIAAVRDWADRHATHAGYAPLSELYTILDGGSDYLLPSTDSDHVGEDID
jgi:hypothetical protein